MGQTAVNGMLVDIASTYATSVNATAASNAANAVVTVASATGLAAGDYVEYTSGWLEVNDRVFRISNVSSNDITLEGCNTLDATRFPAGSGTGSIRKITAWAQIQQLLAVNSSGGEQQYNTFQYLNETRERKIPTLLSATDLSLEVHQDNTLAYWAVVQAAKQAATARALRMTFKNGSKIVGNAYWGASEVPAVAPNDQLKRTLSVSFTSQITEYAS